MIIPYSHEWQNMAYRLLSETYGAPLPCKKCGYPHRKGYICSNCKHDSSNNESYDVIVGYPPHGESALNDDGTLKYMPPRYYSLSKSATSVKEVSGRGLIITPHDDEIDSIRHADIFDVVSIGSFGDDEISSFEIIGIERQGDRIAFVVADQKSDRKRTQQNP